MATRGAAAQRMEKMAETTGLGIIVPEVGLAALRAAVAQAVGPPVLGMVPFDWARMLGGGRAKPAFLSAFVPRGCAQIEATHGQGCAQKDLSLDTVLELVRRTAGSVVDADAPLLEVGVDSLGAVELRNLLQQATDSGTSLPSTLIFDHPTARQLAAALISSKPRGDPSSGYS